MMEQIKFRQPTFLNGKFTGFHYWGFISDQNFTSPIPPIDKAQKESQQFTNLHDKNGKEIFEGDIVKFEAPSCDNLIATATIRYCDMDMCWFAGNWKINAAWGFEIIGNTYENPELIKEVTHV